MMVLDQCFLPSGKGTLAKEDSVAYSLASDNSTVRRFYIRISSYRHMFNPQDMYGDQVLHKASDRTTGKQKYKFEQVNEEVFKTYVKFLRTKNPLWLRQAERLYKDK